MAIAPQVVTGVSTAFVAALGIAATILTNERSNDRAEATRKRLEVREDLQRNREALRPACAHYFAEFWYFVAAIRNLSELEGQSQPDDLASAKHDLEAARRPLQTALAELNLLLPAAERRQLKQLTDALNDFYESRTPDAEAAIDSQNDALFGSCQRLLGVE